MPQTQDVTRATGSNFLTFPPELRTTIYELAACYSATFIYDCGSITIPNSALASVSRQIRSEYLPILQRSPIFATRSTKLLLSTSAFRFNALRDFLHNELAVFSRAREPELEITLLIPQTASLINDPSTANVLELYAWLRACNDPHFPASRTYKAAFDWSVWDRASARAFADDMWTATHLCAGRAVLDSVRMYTALLAARDGAEMLSARGSGSPESVMRRE